MKILLSIGSVLISLILVEATCGWLVSRGHQFHSLFHFSQNPSPSKKPLLPYELPTSLSEMPVYEPTPTPDFHELEDGGNFVTDSPYGDQVAPVNLLPSRTTRMRRYNKVTGRVLFDVEVTADEFFRRISRPPASQRNSSRHLLMVGCSYVFGDAIDNEDTITWAINQQQTEVEAFNGGMSGFGTADVLARFLVHNELLGIPQKDGTLVYNFLEDHVLRATGSSAIGWLHSLSHVVENTDGTFSFAGPFLKSNPLLSQFYGWFAKLNITQLFGLTLPILRDYHYDLIVRMIVATQTEYQKQSSPHNKLVVAIYPQPTFLINKEKFRRSLSEHKIHFLDYSDRDITEYLNGQGRVSYDYHPNALANEFYAKMLIRDLQQSQAHRGNQPPGS